MGRSHVEDSHQTALFNWSRHFKCLRWMFAIPNGGKRNAREGARLKAQGVKAGVHDIFLPAARHGFHGLYIEMKAGNNKLTQLQIEFKEYAERENYKCVTCWTWIEAKREIKLYMSIK